MSIRFFFSRSTLGFTRFVWRNIISTLKHVHNITLPNNASIKSDCTRYIRIGWPYVFVYKSVFELKLLLNLLLSTSVRFLFGGRVSPSAVCGIRIGIHARLQWLAWKTQFKIQLASVSSNISHTETAHWDTAKNTRQSNCRNAGTAWFSAGSWDFRGRATKRFISFFFFFSLIFVRPLSRLDDLKVIFALQSICNTKKKKKIIIVKIAFC